MPEWVIEDTFGVGSKETASTTKSSSTGVLRNPNFPKTVGKNESWSGTIDAVNVGDGAETFRVTKDGETKAEFKLNPGESRTVTFSGTGPTSFTIKLMSKVPSVSKEAMVGIGLAVAAGTGLAYKYLG